VDSIVTEIHRYAKKVSTSEEIAHVGITAANGDEEIGNLLAHAMERSATMAR
jgi:chaperonin GroEL